MSWYVSLRWDHESGRTLRIEVKYRDTALPHTLRLHGPVGAQVRFPHPTLLGEHSK